MRIKADIWVKAYLRTAAANGAFATVLQHGDDERGTILIKVSRMDGTASLYVPAPTGMSDAEPGRDQLWIAELAEGTREADVDERIARERRIDSDIWVVEVEDRKGRHFLEDWIARLSQ